MKPLLLDTNALLWLVRGSPRAGSLAKSIDEGAEVVVSVVTLIEIALKRAIGKLEEDPITVRRTLMGRGSRELPVLAPHVEMLTRLPLLHGDPFDRLLVAQAQTESMAIVTADARLGDYAVDVIPL